METPMRKATVIRGTALAALAFAGSLQAHHSGSMYDPTPVWLKGTVVRFENIDPHTITTVEERSDGQVRRWSIEGPGQFQLAVGTKVPQVGDVLEFCGFPYKSAAELSRLFPGVDFSWRSSPQADDRVWGHLMVTPDAETRLWNPHGMLSECMRSSDDRRQSWLEVLGSNTSLRQRWCQERNSEHVRSTAALHSFVEEIDKLIEPPCE
jgi:hypothetical protein